MDEDAYIIRMLPGNVDVACYEEDTMLEALEREGNPIPFGCRKGQCGSCKAKVIEGEAEISEQASPFALSQDERDAGWILLCSSIPLTDLVTIEVELGEGTM
ncbi:MAG: 2Fe-2S iron-sulfur cluster-binding protein [Acidimicrobiia bacterium]